MDRGKPWVAGVGLLLGAIMAATATMITREPADSRAGEERPPAVSDRTAPGSSKRQLRRQLRTLAELDRDPAVALSRPQAEQLLVLLKPWTTTSKMTEAEAGAIHRSVEKVLTPKQIKAIAQLQDQRDRRFNGPGGPGAGPGGFPGPGNPYASPPPGYPYDPRPPGDPYRSRPPGGGAGPPRFDPARVNAMRDANILSTKEDPDMPWTSRRVQANKRLIALLEARARGKTPDTEF
jgi:hypothetical protein